MFDIPVEWAVAFVTGVASYVGHRLWNRASNRQKQIITAAIGETHSVIHQLVYTAKPGTTVDQIILWAKGAAAVQLAKRGLKPTDPLVAALVNEVIAAAVQMFVVSHPDKSSLTIPMTAKLPK